MSMVEHPKHYNDHPSGIECKEIKAHLNDQLGDAFKYVFRRNSKGNEIQDIEKAIQYLKFELELVSSGKHPRREFCQLGEVESLRQKIEIVRISEPNGSIKMFYLWLSILVNWRSHPLIDFEWCISCIISILEAYRGHLQVKQSINELDWSIHV